MVVTNPGTLGARVGLKAGDILEGINGEAVTDLDEAVAGLKRSGRWFQLHVLRYNQKLNLRFKL